MKKGYLWTNLCHNRLTRNSFLKNASVKKKIRKPTWPLLWSHRGTNMSLSQMRPRTSQLLELHVFYVPAEVWNFKLNTVPVALTSKFISAGFIRVSPHITLRVLRERLGEFLGGVTIADKFRFLKCIGKKLAVVKAEQETELELKSFAPPYALYPELYLLPGVEYFEDVYLSSTQQKHHIIEEANRFGHGSRLSSLSQQKPEKSKPFLRSIHQVENVEVPSPVEWGEKEPVPVSHTNNKQDNNNRITEKQFGEKDENKQNLLTSPKEYMSPPIFKCLLNIIVISLENKMVEQLQQMKKDRRHMEKTREELIKKAKGLLEQNKLRRYHVREEWKKKYFETKKATVSLEDTLNKLRQDLELYHQKLLLQLEARDRQKRPNNATTSKNFTIIRIATVQHELDHLRRKLDDTKMRLLIEIKVLCLLIRTVKMWHCIKKKIRTSQLLEDVNIC
uniref:Spermatogenesis associated 1 n=1 Tax=Catharus ustulatus TaxID=91951 RepID=A0A8C3TZ94_CATUS